MRDKLHEVVRGLWTDESGPTAVEYAILAGGIAAVIIATVGAIGAAVNGLFLKVHW